MTEYVSFDNIATILEARQSELERDRERLDWLEEASILDATAVIEGSWSSPDSTWTGLSIREAIDKAMEAEKS